MEVSRLAVPGASVELTASGPRPGSSTPAVLFLHNLLADRTVFSHAFEAVSAQRRAIALDFRAHGASRAERAFSTQDLVRDALAALDAQGVARAHVVGISLGAWVGCELALAHPDRVAGLVLMGATPWAARPTDARQSRALALAAALVGVRPALVRPVLPLLFGRTFREREPATVAVWERKLLSSGRAALGRALRVWRERPALLDRLGEIRARTLVVVGEEDEAHPPAHGEALAARIPGARVARVKAGHTMTVERPQETTDLVLGELVRGELG